MSRLVGSPKALVMAVTVAEKSASLRGTTSTPVFYYGDSENPPFPLPEAVDAHRRVPGPRRPGTGHRARPPPAAHRARPADAAPSRRRPARGPRPPPPARTAAPRG